MEKQFQGDPADAEDVVTAIAYESGGDEDEARWVFACLDALQVFDREEGGRLRLEPLLRQCLSPGMSRVRPALGVQHPDEVSAVRHPRDGGHFPNGIATGAQCGVE
ncbi:hypothetical protein SHIRM173S_12301 [Streptomyces hirsutus]